MKLKTFFRDQTSILFFSSIIGIGFGLLASILNTRFLAPEEYGNYRYVYNIISFISSLLLFGFFVSGCRLLALEKDISVCRRINGAMVIIVMASIILTMLVMILLYFIQKEYLNPSVATLFIYSIPVCGAPLILNYINTTFQGENRIKELAIARLLPYGIYLPLGYWWYSSFGANSVTLMILQNGSALVILSYLIIRLRPSFVELKPIFKKLNIENKRYGFHVYVGSVLAVSLAYLSGITLGIFEENNINVGYYTLALTVSMPLSILPTIVGTTHFKEFASQNNINRKIIKNTVLITFVSLFAFVLMIIPLVEWVYTADYAIVGYYSCFLAIGMVAHGFGDMYNRFLGAHGKGREIRNGAVVTGMIQLLGSFGLVYLWGIYGAIMTRIISSIVYFILMIYYYNKIKQDLIGYV